MEEIKKRKLQELGFESQPSVEEHLCCLLDPLNKPQLIDLLTQLGTEHPSIAEKIKSVATADPVHRKLFVRGLSLNTTTETLCDAFRVHGEIEEGAVIYDKATGKSRGYGFITYSDIESTQITLRASSMLIDGSIGFPLLTDISDHIFIACFLYSSQGRMVVCNLACEGLSGASATPDLPQRKLYICGLSPDVTSEILLSFFGRHGEIEEGSVAYDKDTSESRGFGFVTYKTVEATKKALDDPNKILGGRSVMVKLADSHRGRTQSHVSSPVGGPGYPGAQFGYGYPHYRDSLYSSPTAYVPFPTQPQVSYAAASLKKDGLGRPPTNSMGMSGYPYYMANH